VESSSLEIFKTRLDKVLCSLLWVTLLWQGVGLGDPQRSLPTPNIVICARLSLAPGLWSVVPKRVTGRGVAVICRELCCAVADLPGFHKLPFILLPR